MVTLTPSTPKAVAYELCSLVAMTFACYASLVLIDRQAGLGLSKAFLTALALVILPLITFSLLERVLPAAGPRKSLRHWLLHLRINVFINYAATLVATSLLAAFTAAMSQRFDLGLIDLRFASGRGVLAWLGAVVVSMLVGDFFFYWYHRFQHQNPILWQIHKVHHMDPALDALTDGRHSWVDQLPRVLFIFIPLTLLFKLDDVDPLKLGLANGLVVGSIQIVQRCLEHCNIRLHLRWMTPILCGPQIHRIHHSRLQVHWDRNFAGVTPLWDILFGTYYAPARNEYPPTGVDQEPEFETFFEAQTLTLKQWGRMFSTWAGSRFTRSKSVDQRQGASCNDQ